MSERQEFKVSGEVIDHSGEGGERSYTAADFYYGLMKVIGGTGNNFFFGGHRGDWYQGGSNRGARDIAEGGQGSDFLAGGKGANILKGDGWSDILVGNFENAYHDLMHGGNGHDTLVAGRVDWTTRDYSESPTVGPKLERDAHGNITGGNVMWGDEGDDTFELHRDSYVHIADFNPDEDIIRMTGLAGHSLEESIDVVYHPRGPWGDSGFRLVLDGSTVIAEVNYTGALDSSDPDSIQGAIDKITAKIHAVQGSTFFGSQGNDQINGTKWNDTIYGWGGDDVIAGGSDGDIIYGGSGNDTVYGNGGDDVLYGDHGNDTVWGNAGDDVVDGGQGNDVLYGGGGEDVLFGAGGNDRLDGGAGADQLYGGRGRDIFVMDASGKTPDVIFDFKVGEDYVRLPLGLAQADVRFVAVAGFTNPYDGSTVAAQKLVTGSEDSEKTLAVFLNMDGQDLSKVDYIWDFDPNKEYPPPPSGETINGTAKKDLLLGTRGDDTINGGDGKDDLYGRDGDDTLNGGEGHDKLYGENGNDTLNGGAGNDVLEGGAGDDFLYGNDGDDVLRGGSGNDTLEGNDGDDRLFGGAGNDTMSGGNGIDRLYGGSGDDTLDGDDGADRLEGGEGNDILVGGKHDDRLIGDGGNDRLQGGKDADYLTGGEGADEFLFRKGDGVDVITDFEDGTDTIVFLAEKENKLGSKFIGFKDLVFEETEYGVRITSGKLKEGHEILLQGGVTVDQLDENDFGFVTIEEYNGLLEA